MTTPQSHPPAAPSPQPPLPPQSQTPSIAHQHQHQPTTEPSLLGNTPCDDKPSSQLQVPHTVVNLDEVSAELKNEIKCFVDSIFTDSQSISLAKKADFGKLVRTPEARLLFAMYLDEHRVKCKRVSELTFYSLAQYFSIVLLECLLAEDFRPAKIIMNMMFTYYYEQIYDKPPTRKHSAPSASTNVSHGNTATSKLSAIKSLKSTLNQKRSPVEGEEFVDAHDDGGNPQHTTSHKTYLYTLLKDQQIFKSIRFWTSAFYESVIIERNNHSVFVDRNQGKLSNEKRNEELDCSKNITFGLLGSFIYNMSLLDLSHEFCQEFLDKHSTIAGLSDEQLELLRANLKAVMEETSSSSRAPSNGVSQQRASASTGDKLATFLKRLSSKLNNSTQAASSSFSLSSSSSSLSSSNHSIGTAANAASTSSTSRRSQRGPNDVTQC